MLDPVMTLGYPPIPGFPQTLISETSEIAGKQIGTLGHLIGRETAYLDRQAYWVISARVKGGSSGGPAISEKGKVLGIVTQMASGGGTGGGATPDPLVFGALVPSDTVLQLKDSLNDLETVADVRFELQGEAVRLTEWT